MVPYTDNDHLVAGYIGEFEIVDDHRSGKIVVQLNGRLNKTGVISPRYNVQAKQIESWVNLLLPARGFGIIILVSAKSTLPIHQPSVHSSLRFTPLFASLFFLMHSLAHMI